MAVVAETPPFKETSRLENFSDGVFAIAITLLALELKVPHVDGAAALGDALREQWPSYLAFVLSFVTILIMWMNHHGMFAWIEEPDISVLVSNGFLLLLVAAVPFPTALVGEYLGHAGESTAMAVYAGFYVAINLAYVWVWAAMVRHRAHVAPGLPDAEVRVTNRYLAIGLTCYLAAFAMAFYWAAVSFAICMALAAFWLYNAIRRNRLGNSHGASG